MIKNKKIAVFGLGISGKAVINYLKKNGFHFIAWDDSLPNAKNNYIEFENFLFPLNHQAWQDFDYLILSPGIPLHYPSPHAVINLAQKAGAKIICDLELFYLLNPDKFFIGITGTNGKSTTAALIAHILRTNGFDAIECGNIGLPIFETPENNVYVVEISSYQLDLIDQMEFDIAVLLNITPDHTERHGSFENYTKSKHKIFNQIDKHVINFDLLQRNYLKQNRNILEKISNINLLGEHNQQNICAASLCALEIGLKINQIVYACNSFQGLKHRLQYLGKINDVTFINDSKATNADATANGLKIFNNIIWILGGITKEGGIQNLSKYFPKIKKALLIGKAQDEFSKELNNQVAWVKCENLENAFNLAKNEAQPGDIVLLSPACASFDQWENFEARGDAFISMFNQYKDAFNDSK